LLVAPASVSVNFIQTILKARSLENQIITVFCNRVGVDNGIYYSGGSSIFYPDGEQVVADNSPTLKIAHLSEQQLLGFLYKRQSFFQSAMRPPTTHSYFERQQYNDPNTHNGSLQIRRSPQSRFNTVE
jgi:predicted amidohydrolase